MPQKINIVDVEGTVKGERVIPEDVLIPSRINGHVLFEAVNVEHQNRRQGTHETKTKGEVSGTGKKPYRQKHTGRARQGSRRNPHYRGGGVVFGVSREKNYCIRTNKKVSKIALVSVWFKIVESSKISIFDGSFSKTKEVLKFLEKLGISESKILLITQKGQKEVSLSSRNVSNIRLRSPSSCSVRDLMDQNYLLITNEALTDFFEKLKSWK